MRVDVGPGQWSGLDLLPLPFESTVTSIWRFAWRNVLGAGQLNALFRDSQAYPNRNFFDGPFPFDMKRFKSTSGWEIPSPEELEFARGICELNSLVWVEPNFRYCPLCLEHGYHSFLYQLSQLICCPIHLIELSVHCHSCSIKTQAYRFSKELFGKPYCCAVCKMPICGVAPHLEAHLDFRQRAKEIAITFQPILEWYRATQVARIRINQLNPKNGTKWSLYTWCNPSEFIRSMVCAGTKLPEFFSSPKYTNFTLVSWQMEFYHDENFYNRTGRRTWHVRVRIPTAVYRCTLRALERWVDDKEHFSAEEYRRHFFFKVSDSTVDVRGYKPKLLALQLMRWHLERTFRSCKRNNWSSAQLDDEPNVQIPIYQDRTPRLAWRAIFIGIYASWYHIILAAKGKGSISLYDVPGSEDQFLFSYLNSEIELNGKHRVSGAVAFPTIEGLPAMLNRKL